LKAVAKAPESGYDRRRDWLWRVAGIRNISQYHRSSALNTSIFLSAAAALPLGGDVECSDVSW